MNAMSFDPFGGFDRLASGLMQNQSGSRPVPVDLLRDGDRYLLNADLPGVDPGSVDIDLDGNLLTIRAERTAALHDGAKWIARERQSGSYYRQFVLGEGIATEDISATYDNGVLSVVIPVSEKAKPRKIRVANADDQAALTV